MVNPLLEAHEETNKLRPWLFDINIPVRESSEDEQQKIDNIWNEVFVNCDKRLPLITLQSAQLHESSYDSVNYRYKLDHDQAAAHFTKDAFEACLIGLALSGRWNDVLESACKALGFDVEGNWDEQLKEYLRKLQSENAS